MSRWLAWGALAGLVLALVCLPSPAAAQYFGRNKVQYRTFSFQILKTEHFDLYYYPEERDAAQVASRMAERWYARLSRFFDHQLHNRQVLILYAAPEHFRQTNAVEGLIGEGTGGVTEALKRRIVLPMSGSLTDTNHVIGHELVHAFQFDMTGTDPREATTGSGPGILQYPLWFVEGMAEYLSLGPVDAQTAMWMRDAALREKLPSIRDLDKPEYFPYRWGHSFWAFIGAKFGDRTVASLVRSAANPRFDLVGMARQLGTDPDTLTADWHAAILAAARTVLDDRPSIESDARILISKATGSGRFNIGPRLSPDGRQIAFFSERDRFSIELFLADADSGRIERKLVHSAGAWSPDGKTLALAAVRRGQSMLALVDPRNGHVTREVPLTGLDDAINPSYSPDGRSIVLSGNHGGFIDLFLVSLDSGRLDQLTHDPFADLEPTFTPDGKSIVFVTERFSTDLTTLEPGPLRLARLNIATGEVSPIAAFLSGKHISPQVSADGQTLTFVAEPDGVSNLYRMPIDGGPILQVSSFATGVAGITSVSPALSAAAQSGRLAFSVFIDSGHAIYVLEPSSVVATVAREASGQAALLPGRTVPSGDVERMLEDVRRGLPAASTTPASVPYTHALALDMLGRPTITGGISQFGGFVGGSMSAFFSDMLGDRMLGVSGQVAGGLADIGGQLVYVNRRHRWNWASVIEQIPYRIDNLSLVASQAANRLTFTDQIERQTFRGGSAVVSFPFSPATRMEFSGGVHAVSSTLETQALNYALDTQQLIDRTSVKSTFARPLRLAESSAALVYDTSYFGATSPIFGRRYRFEVDETAGSLVYTSVLADWRQYFMPRRPITVALRAVHVGRYGHDAEDPQLVSLYAGYPELVHGYGLGSVTPADCHLVSSFNAGSSCAVFDSLVGSRLLVMNAEVRAPLVGLFRGDIQYGQVPIEVAAFMDAGLTWTKATRPAFLGGTRDVLRSVGGAVRVNVFGLLIVELAASHPLDRIDHHLQWQIAVREGF
jgi:Tol biopolymer transport system component